MHPITHRSRTTALTLATALAIVPQLTLAATPTSYIGPDNGLWSNPANWSNGIPNSTAFDALINNPSPLTVQLDASQTINNLSLNAPDTLSLLATLTLSGTSSTNTGTLLFNTTASTPTLFLTTNTTLSGGGVLLMSSTASKITGTSGMRLTTDNLISGSGNIGKGLLKISNAGTITVTAGSLVLQPAIATDGFLNTGLLVANGGTLVLQPANYVNANATIEALNGSIVSIQPGGTVTGGTIAGLGGTVSLAGLFQNASLSGVAVINVNVAIFIGSNSNSGFISGSGSFSASTASLYNSGSIILSGATLTNSTFNNNGLFSGTNSFNSSGAIVNNAGTMTLGAGTITNSTFNNTGTISLVGAIMSPTSSVPCNLTGGGLLLMNSVNAKIINSGFGLVSNNTIQGFGSISGSMTSSTSNTSNTGVIIATGGSLSVSTIANSGTLRTDGGTLSLSGGIYNLPIQGAGGVIESVNSSPIFITGSVSGGTIRANGNSTITLSGTGPPVFNNALLTSIGGTMTLAGNGQLHLQDDTLSGTITLASSVSDVLEGTITNNGVWTVKNTTFSPAFPLIYSGNGLLMNNGTLNFDLATLQSPGSITQSASFPIVNNGLLAIGIGPSGSISGFGSLNSSASLFSSSGTLAVTQGVLSLGAPFTFRSLIFSPTSSNSVTAIYLNSDVSVTSGFIGTPSATNSGVFVNSPLTLARDTTIYNAGLGASLTLTSNVFNGTANFLAAGGNWYAGTLANPTEILPNGNPPSHLPGIPGWQFELSGNNPNFIIGTAGPKVIDGVAFTIDAGATVDWLSFSNPQWLNLDLAATHIISLKNGATIANHGTLYAYMYGTSNLPNIFVNADGNSNNAFYNFGIFGRHLPLFGQSLSFGLAVTLQIPMFNSGFIDVQWMTLQFAGGFIDTSTPNQPATFNVSPGGTLSLTAGAVTILSPMNNINGTLLFNASSQSVTSISGTGTLSVGGSLVAIGALALAGGITISAGTLQIGNNSSTGSLDSALTNNGTLILNRSNTLSLSNPISGTGTLTHAGTGTTTLAAYTATGPLNVTAGKLVLPGSAQPPVRTSALTIAGTPSAPTATLDLQDGALILSYTGTGTPETNTLYSQITAGKGTLDANALFSYNAPGITSSSARSNNLANGLNLFALGILNNADLSTFGINPAYNSTTHLFLNQPVAPNSILLRYTYAGDINLDGTINIDDYNYIDTAFANPAAYPTGWLAGDFNNDGKINIDDYNLIDTAFAFQSAPLSTPLTPLGDTSPLSLTTPSGTSAPVPEPTSLTLLALGTATLLRRRRYR